MSKRDWLGLIRIVGGTWALSAIVGFFFDPPRAYVIYVSFAVLALCIKSLIQAKAK